MRKIKTIKKLCLNKEFISELLADDSSNLKGGRKISGFKYICDPIQTKTTCFYICEPTIEL